MSKALTARERAHLKARAHALEPVVHAGSSGVTDTLVAEVDRALTAHVSADVLGYRGRIGAIRHRA
jgi:RNA-binding protein